MADEPEFTLEQQKVVDAAVATAKKAGKDSMAKKYSDYDEVKGQLADLAAKRKAEADKGKTEVEKLQSALDDQTKGMKALGEEMKALKAFKTEADLQAVVVDRCKALNLDPKYAKYASGETEEEIDESLKVVYADFQPKTLGAGGGAGGEGDSGSNKAINDYIRGA
jgi:hypothetical protein